MNHKALLFQNEIIDRYVDEWSGENMKTRPYKNGIVVRLATLLGFESLKIAIQIAVIKAKNGGWMIGDDSYKLRFILHVKG